MIQQTIPKNPTITKQINVTHLTACQKRELFIEQFKQDGFTGFAKRKIGDQSYFIFSYRN